MPSNDFLDALRSSLGSSGQPEPYDTSQFKPKTTADLQAEQMAEANRRAEDYWKNLGKPKNRAPAPAAPAAVPSPSGSASGGLGDLLGGVLGALGSGALGNLPGPLGMAQSALRPWQQIAKDALDLPSRPGLVDVAKLMTKVPLRSGFYSRLLDGTTTDEDRAAAHDALGGDLTPGLREDIIGQFARNYANNAAAWNTKEGADQPILPPGQSLATLTAGAIGNLFRNSFAGQVLAPRPGAPAAPGTPGAEAAPGEGPVFTEATPGGSRNDMPLGGSSIDAATGQNTSQSVFPVGQGFTVDRGAGGTSGAAILKGPDGRVLGRAVTDAAGNVKWSFTADPTDENLRLAAQSGLFDQGDLIKYRSDLQGMFKTARDMEWADLNNQFGLKAKEIELKLKTGELDLAKAKAELEAKSFEIQAQKAAVDIAATKAQLALQPLVEQEMRQRISQADLTMQQAEEKFPYELQLLEEQVANAQSQRAERERAAARQQAGDSFMGQMMPGLLAAMGGKGSAAFAGAQPGQPATGQPAPAVAATSQVPGGSQDNLGPPPVYAALSQGAGVAPNDPAAQMAWGVLSQMFSQQQGA
jgi:hypothetical protein